MISQRILACILVPALVAAGWMSWDSPKAEMPELVGTVGASPASVEPDPVKKTAIIDRCRCYSVLRMEIEEAILDDLVQLHTGFHDTVERMGILDDNMGDDPTIGSKRFLGPDATRSIQRWVLVRVRASFNSDPDGLEVVFAAVRLEFSELDSLDPFHTATSFPILDDRSGFNR